MGISLGNGNITFGDATVQSSAFNKITVTKIMPLYHGYIAQTSDNKLYSWGYGDANGATGQGVAYNTIASEIQFPSSETGTILDWCSQGLSCYCLFSTGNLYAWGYNVYGQLGLGNTTSYLMPTLTATGITNIYYPKLPQAITANGTWGTFMVIKSSNGNFYITGYNGYGNLANGTTTNITTWTVLAPPTGKTISTVWYNNHPYNKMFCKTTDNLIYAVGENGTGSLGIGTTTNVSSWTQVTYFNTITDVIDIQIGGAESDVSTYTNNYMSTYVLTAAGDVHACGDNGHGQLGDGTITQRTSFYKVVLTKPVAKIVRGSLNVYVIFTDNTYAKWGFNGYGQMGNGTTTPVLSPLYSSTTCTNIFQTQRTHRLNSFNGFFIIRGGILYFVGRNDSHCGTPYIGSDANVTTESAVSCNFTDKIADIVCSGAGNISSLFRLTNSGVLYGAGRNDMYELNNQIATALLYGFRIVFNANRYRK